MRKEHKYKRSREFESEILDNCKDGDDLLNEFKDLPRKKKKHKSHRYKNDHEGSVEKISLKESSIKISEKIVHIHGSSSEEENDLSELQERVSYKSYDLELDRHTDHSKKKEKKSRKKHRSRSESPCKYDSSTKRKHLSKKYRGTSESDSEDRNSEHWSRNKSSDSGRLRKEDRKLNERNNERDYSESKIKNKTNSVNVKSESMNSEVKKHSKAEKNGRSDSFESSNNVHHKQGRNKSREQHEWGGSKNKSKSKTAGSETQKPNFGLSGKLAEDSNIFNGVFIKYSEPPEARMPKKRWRLYPFKGDQGLPTLYIHRQSAYLLGRDRKVADIPIDHPSCSKQHAALQYRLIHYNRSDGTQGKQIRLYIIDLESANGTFINNNKIEPKKYVELFEKDVIKFGFSSREYVLLHEHSKDEDEDEDDS